MTLYNLIADYRDGMEHFNRHEFASYFADKFVPLMDDIQMIMDKSEFSSELHFILKRKN